MASSKVCIDLLGKELCEAVLAPDFQCETIRQVEYKLKEALHEEEVYWEWRTNVGVGVMVKWIFNKLWLTILSTFLLLLIPPIFHKSRVVFIKGLRRSTM